MTDTDKIIHDEIEGILYDIVQAYYNSGRKVTGNFEEGLDAVYEPNKATIRGFTYLAGRGATKNTTAGNPTVFEAIKKWIKDKGIVAREGENISENSLAYLITRKIHREGTDRSEWLKIYEQVITPERINSIIQKVSVLNVNRIITEITAELEVLAKNV